jgi:6-phosphogluconolactonase
MQVVRAGSDLTEVATEVLIGALSESLDANGRASLAVSGGRTPWPILSAMSRTDLDWPHLDVYQVDERVTPAGDPSRNLTGLDTALLDHVPAVVYPMPVEAPDLEAAAHAYSQELPEILDVVHLGLGDDGHTASLVPGDPVLDVDDRAVAITEPYRGHRRMTLTYPALERAAAIVWIVAGTDKASMVERLLAADPTIPAGRVAQDRAILVTNSI